ncbi:cysteine hydrolase family protein [Providencia sp. SP181]|uniref:cysteine hydrolase family protein n=1 Tax=Providencia sp. SP181 TaxID=3136277 RepID=UPI003D2E06E3
MNKALIIIDAQNDYLSDGRFPLWNIDETLKHISDKTSQYEENGYIVIFIQHLSPQGAAFFDETTQGCELISSLTKLSTKHFIVTKHHGNSFDETQLDDLLITHNINDIELCGMMTQNCVLFTAISEQAKKYKLTLLSDCCTSVSPIIHTVALRGLSRIVNVV